MGGLVGFSIFIKLRRLSFLTLLDLFVPALALAQGFGRFVERRRPGARSGDHAAILHGGHGGHGRSISAVRHREEVSGR